jgi:hypothetical protein
MRRAGWVLVVACLSAHVALVWGRGERWKIAQFDGEPVLMPVRDTRRRALWTVAPTWARRPSVILHTSCVGVGTAELKRSSSPSGGS